MPEIEKSPLTCITDKVSCDREVPQHESNKVSKAIIMVQDFTTPLIAAVLQSVYVIQFNVFFTEQSVE